MPIRGEVILHFEDGLVQGDIYVIPKRPR
ncbi:hypothetical protein AGR6A_Lc80027 [Agrobacterium sp. NCPPB 925]|nr:hypothetical protein AGR6A_Lc80027 [Agrobacterium sp. NCPPB 925]